jgi:replicative DNA helicase
MTDNLRHYDGPDKMISSWDLRSKLKASGSELWRIDTGLNRLDELTEGVGQGELVVVSGYTGNGKTLLAQSVTHNLTNKYTAEENENPGWFSFEVMPAQFIKQFGDNTPLFYVPETYRDNSLKWIKERILESIAKYHTKIFFIDHLHYIVPFTSTSMSLTIGAVMRELKLFALANGIAIVLLCHTTKSLADKEPDISDARDSSFIGQECDTFIIVWRLDNPDYDNKARLKVCKCRWTGKRNKTVNLQKVGNYLEEDIDANAGY